VLERRGRSSFVLNDAPLLFVDGVQLPDFRNLQSIPATQLASIEILDGVDGTTYYGTGAEGGVILIRTKSGS
jgi:outer membrane receptor protein involved in Fe transport